MRSLIILIQKIYTYECYNKIYIDLRKRVTDFTEFTEKEFYQLQKIRESLA